MRYSSSAHGDVATTATPTIISTFTTATAVATVIIHSGFFEIVGLRLAWPDLLDWRKCKARVVYG